MEPGIAAFAAERRSQEHLEEMQASIDEERKAGSAEEAHDASRRFHLALARATGNDEFVRCIDGLWIVEVGRWALGAPAESRRWQQVDADEHAAVAAAVARAGAARRGG